MICCLSECNMLNGKCTCLNIWASALILQDFCTFSFQWGLSVSRHLEFLMLGVVTYTAGERKRVCYPGQGSWTIAVPWYTLTVSKDRMLVQTAELSRNALQRFAITKGNTTLSITSTLSPTVVLSLWRIQPLQNKI